MFDDQGRGWIPRDDLWRILRANFLDSEDIDVRELDVLRVLKLDQEDEKTIITYEQFMTVSKTHGNLIFPVDLLINR